MIPHPAHPWSPWRPVAVAGWAFAALLAWGVLCAIAMSVAAAWRHDDQCALRWQSTKTMGDSVRVAGDCGAPRARVAVGAERGSSASLNGHP